jgi:hypothetical protein
MIIVVPASNKKIDRSFLEMRTGDLETTYQTRQELIKALRGKGKYTLYNLSAFQDAWNNEELTAEDHWLGFVTVSKD